MCQENENVHYFEGACLGIDVAEWIEDVHASLRARHLAPVDQAHFKLRMRYGSDLEGKGKIQKRFFSILQELYACSQSYVALQEDFFGRKQLEGESLKEYSHSLFSLMERVVKCAPNTQLCCSTWGSIC